MRCSAIVSALEENGHQVAATDLYREQFDPVMSADERRSYYEARDDNAAVAAETALLRRVDGVIFCFPHWWFSMPAMLKGYFDRVWAPGIAFGRDRARGRLQPLLTHVKLFGAVTTYGSPWWITHVVAGDPGRKVLMRALKPMCGRRVRSFFLAVRSRSPNPGRTRSLHCSGANPGRPDLTGLRQPINCRSDAITTTPRRPGFESFRGSYDRK